MMAENLRGKHFDELTVGQIFESEFHLITADRIRSFAVLMGETNPLHVDEAFASQSPFGRIVASGSFGLTLAISLIEETEVFHGTAIAALGIDEWRYQKPIVANQEVRSRMTISKLRPRAGDPTSGVVDRYFELVDVEGVLLQSGLAPILVKTRTT
jgi:acyl dehydratase